MRVDASKPVRRLQMLAMARGGATAKDIARHFRYTVRHVRRELAEARRAEKAEGVDTADIPGARGIHSPGTLSRGTPGPEFSGLS